MDKINQKTIYFGNLNKSMRLKEITIYSDRILNLIEDASGGATGAGSIATVAGNMGNISRTPNLFGWIPPKKKKKRTKRKT